MRPRRTTLLSLLVASVLTLTTVSWGGVPAGAAQTRSASEQAAPLRYVALGDSYSAATGVLPVVVGSPPQCLRSERNYPHLIADRLDADLTDVSCGAAETADFFTSQGAGIPPQLRALDRRTQLVTMTIGGNDSGVFINAILQCGAASVTTLGRGSPCREQYGSSFVRTIRTTTLPSLRKALRAVHRRAPRAEVAILGYPRILPRRGGCYPQMPVARGDVPYLFNLQRVLNNAVRRAARATDSIYVDTPRASKGHDACQPLAKRWIEPVLLGTNPVIVHPNARGEAAMARVTLRRLGLS